MRRLMAFPNRALRAALLQADDHGVGGARSRCAGRRHAARVVVTLRRASRVVIVVIIISVTNAVSLVGCQGGGKQPPAPLAPPAVTASVTQRAGGPLSSPTSRPASGDFSDA